MLSFKTGIMSMAIVAILFPDMGLAEGKSEVNLYSARKEKLIKPLLDIFYAQTGVKVNLVTGKADALLKKLKSEGMNSPADVLLTTDAGRLHRAKSAGVTQAFRSTSLEKVIPTQYRDKEGHWYGLSLRLAPSCM